MKTFLRYAGSFAAPVVICLILPYFIIRLGGLTPNQSLQGASLVRAAAGGVIIAAGAVLFGLTVRMFILIGKGTIMPWDPTQHLITGSLYGHVRNPMILSLIVLLTGEAILFASWGIGLLAFFNWAVNTVYFRLSEEPGLEKRFGDEYREYKSHVPRWFPRLHAWRPGNHRE